MAKIRNLDSFGAVFPHFCPDKCEIWHGGADGWMVLNSTLPLCVPGYRTSLSSGGEMSREVAKRPGIETSKDTVHHL